MSTETFSGMKDSQTALRRTVMIINQRGLHARAAAKFVKLAGEFDAEVAVERNGTAVSGMSIMGLMMLGAAMGDEITISAEGDGAEAAVTSLSELVEAQREATLFFEQWQLQA